MIQAKIVEITKIAMFKSGTEMMGLKQSVVI